MFMIEIQGRAAVCSKNLEPDMNCLAPKGQESATQINELAQTRPSGPDLIITTTHKL